MGKSTTPSFCLTLKLNTSKRDEQILEYRFLCGQRIYNVLVRHCRKQFVKLFRDPEYRELLKERSNKDLSRKEKNALNQRLAGIRMDYGLSKYQLYGYVKLQQHRYKKHIDSRTAQGIASAIWKSCEKYLFDNGREIHFKKRDDLCSLESNSNDTGIMYRNGYLVWNKLTIAAPVRPKDTYAKEAIKHRIKYCRVIRKPVGARSQYYMQLILEGLPPVKHPINHGRIGIDIGTSSVAAVGEEFCHMTVLAKEAAPVEQRIRRLQRKMDRSRRAANPDNYNPDGTVVRKPHKFKESNTYRKDRQRLRTLQRKRADVVRQSHERLANQVLQNGNEIYVEKMTFSGLARRSAKTETDKNGRCKKKSRYGKSIGNRAPAKFLKILNRKLSYEENEIHQVNTQTFRASQYNHVTDDYIKKKLSQRGQQINGTWIQRDLYSAFLLMNAAKDLSHADRERCFATYENFVRNHNKCIENLKYSNEKLPSSFGIRAA